MRRRAYLSSVAGVVGGLAGCVGARVGETTSANPTPTAVDPPATGTPSDADRRGRHGFPPGICEESARDVNIIEIVVPEFGPNWAGTEVNRRYGELTDDDVVIGVERDGAARAYPLSILWHHEIVNDELGGPLLVTYCPLCKSGMVAERRVNGDATIFRVSGLLWSPEGIEAANAEHRGRVFGADRASGPTSVVDAGNLVMVDDATRSYWSQLLAEAICGPQRGERLTIVPSLVARWGEWRAAHPRTDVLLPPRGPSPPDLA